MPAARLRSRPRASRSRSPLLSTATSASESGRSRPRAREPKSSASRTSERPENACRSVATRAGSAGMPLILSLGRVLELFDQTRDHRRQSDARRSATAPRPALATARRKQIRRDLPPISPDLPSPRRERGISRRDEGKSGRDEPKSLRIYLHRDEKYLFRVAVNLFPDATKANPERWKANLSGFTFTVPRRDFFRPRWSPGGARRSVPWERLRRPYSTPSTATSASESGRSHPRAREPKSSASRTSERPRPGQDRPCRLTIERTRQSAPTPPPAPEE